MKWLSKFIVNLLIKNKQMEKLDQIPIDQVKTILLMSNTAIGDTVFNTPIFRSLKQHYPEKKVIVLLNPGNYKLFETNPYIDEIILYDGRWKKFFSVLSTLKNRSIDLTLILHSNEPQATPLALLGGSKYILKIPNDNNKYNKYHTNKPIAAIEEQHGIYDRLRQLEYIDINETNPTTELYLKNEWVEKVNQDFNTKKVLDSDAILIGFQIGASTISRMWFEERWVELGKKLLEENKNIKIILTGSPDERKLTTPIKEKIESERVLNYAGVFDLGSAAALIGKLDLLITPDTGPMHIAAALKIPTIGFFIAAKWYGSNPCHDENIHLYIQKEQTCTPCIGKRCKFQECMYQITIEDVINKIKELDRGLI